MDSNLIISPKTKVLQLLETYPQLEQVLINMVPAFVKLKNPVLRKTVAKIASLQQAAAIGNVSIELLINTLRKAVGQENIKDQIDSEYNIHQPVWFSQDKIFHELDIREMINAGEHPVNQVISDLNQLPAGKVYQVTAPFLTAPLIDKASSLNILHWVDQVAPELYHIYFYKQ